MDEEVGRLGLTINIEKIKAMKIKAKNSEMIMMVGQGIEEVNKFTYLGATVCKER